MDACAAFSFVFNAETARKYSGLRSLAQAIQVSSYVHLALDSLFLVTSPHICVLLNRFFRIILDTRIGIQD